MAGIIALTEIGRRSAEAFNAQGVLVREHWIVYRAFTDGVGTDGQLVLNSPFLRPFGSFYQSPEGVTNAGMRLVSREPENNPELPTEWTITDRYSSLWFSTLTSEPNPLLRPPVYRRTRQEFQEPMEADFFNDSMANSSDEPYDPPVTREVGRRIITVTLNVPAPFNERKFDEEIDNCTNDVTWKGYPANTVKVSGADSQQITEGAFTYDQVTITLKIKYGVRVVLFEGYNGAGGPVEAGGFKKVWRKVEDGEEVDGMEWLGWDMLKVDQGFRRNTSGSRGGLTAPIMRSGVPINRPVLLDGLGQELTAAAWPLGSAAPFTIPRYHRYFAYFQISFEEMLGI